MRHCDRELRGVEVSGARRGGPAIASRRAATMDAKVHLIVNLTCVSVATLHDKTKDITRGALKPRRLLGCGCPAAREERGFHRAHFGPAGDKCGPCELGCAEQNKYNALHTARAAARITPGTPSRPIARKEITIFPRTDT